MWPALSERLNTPALHVSGVKHPFSGGTTLAVFLCELYLLAGCKLGVDWFIGLGGVGAGLVAW
jgi:hypothetical protein